MISEWRFTCVPMSAEGTDFGSNGGHIAGRETFGAVV
jgi:hypothetical protein